MKKNYALMIGEQIIRISGKNRELVSQRNAINSVERDKKAYIVTWLGRVKVTAEKQLTVNG